MKHTILILLLFTIFKVQAQDDNKKQVLSLDDAILKRFSTLSPQRMTAIQWVKGTDQISAFNKTRDEVTVMLPGTRKPDVRLKLYEINDALQIAMKRLPMIYWINANTFYFHHENTYYHYDMTTRKGMATVAHPSNAQNPSYHAMSKRLAYTIDNNLYIATTSNEKIAVTSNINRDVVSGQAIARREFGIRKGIFWSPDGSQLAFYEKDESDVADYPLLDITTTPGQVKMIKYPMAGQKSEYARVGVFDVSTSETYYLDIDGARDQFLTNLGWGPDNQHIYLAIVNRDQNEMKLNKYNTDSRKLIKTLFEEKDERYVEPESPVWFLPNNPTQFIWLSERDGYTHAYLYDHDGNLIRQITKGEWEVEEVLGLSNSKKNLIVRGTDESGLNTYAYSVDMKTGKMNKLSQNSGQHRYQLSDKGIFLIDQYSSIKTPFVVDIINTRGKKVVNLLASTNPLSDYKVGTVELVDVKAADGTELHARLIKPSNFDPKKKYPVLVYVYGGPHAQMVTNSWMAGAPLWMYAWAERGYLVWTLDNRGSANRGFDFESAIHRQLGMMEMEDQMVGIDYLKNQSFVDKNRLAIHGWSYGGFMTLSMMLKKSDVFKVGVAGGPVTDWKFYEVMYGERYMDRPEENADGYEKSSLLPYAKNLKGDLMLIHGTVDDVVVMQHNLTLIQKFVKEGILVDFFPYPNHPHNVRGKDRVHLMKKVLYYIDDKLEIPRIKS